MGAKNRLFEFDEKHPEELEKLHVVGDIHGYLDIFDSLSETVNLAKDGVIFLGDYADRGPSGVEVIEQVSSLMEENPENVVALKGNHEDYEHTLPTFGPCDLINEVKRKEGEWIDYYMEKFNPFVNKLYLAAVLPGETLFVHGGISDKIKSPDDLRYPTKEIELDVLWSDPSYGCGQRPNRRGEGVEFGADITESICELLGVKRVIRSHEPGKARSGPFYEHDRRVITTSSTRCYGGTPFIFTIDLNEPKH